MTENGNIDKDKVLDIYVESLKAIRHLSRTGAAKTEITNELEKIVTEVVDDED
jgi:hypothetical protein